MKDQKDKRCRFIFLQPFLIIFTRCAINYDHYCIYVSGKERYRRHSYNSSPQCRDNSYKHWTIQPKIDTFIFP